MSYLSKVSFEIKNFISLSFSDSVRGVKVSEEPSIKTLQFEAKTVEENVNMAT